MAWNNPVAGIGNVIDDEFDDTADTLLENHVPLDGGSWIWITNTPGGWTKGAAAYKLKIGSDAGEGVVKMVTASTMVGYEHSSGSFPNGDYDIFFNWVTYDDVSFSNVSEVNVAWYADPTVRTGYVFGYDLSGPGNVFLHVSRYDNDVRTILDDFGTWETRGVNGERREFLWTIRIRGSTFTLEELTVGGSGVMGSWTDTTYTSGNFILNQQGVIADSMMISKFKVVGANVTLIDDPGWDDPTDNPTPDPDNPDDRPPSIPGGGLPPDDGTPWDPDPEDTDPNAPTPPRDGGATADDGGGPSNISDAVVGTHPLWVQHTPFIDANYDIGKDFIPRISRYAGWRVSDTLRLRVQINSQQSISDNYDLENQM